MGSVKAFDLLVREIIRETDDACSVVLDVPPALRDTFRYRPGQFLTFEIPYQGTILRRCYSLASSPAANEAHKVTVKRVEAGRISTWFNEQLEVGHTVRVLPPEGRFVMKHDSCHVMLFAGGSGITPIISMLKAALATSSRTLTLVYANRDPGSVIFSAEIEQLQLEFHARLRVVHRYDSEHGYLSEGDVGSLLEGCVRDLGHASEEAPDVEYFLCGPAPFMDVVERALLTRGVPSGRIHLERFLSPVEPGAEAAFTHSLSEQDVPSSIEIELAGKEYVVPYNGQTLLQAALDAGLDAPYSCEAGICGCCTARLLHGEVRTGDDQVLTAEEKKRGLILCCQAHPVTERCRIEFVDA